MGKMIDRNPSWWLHLDRLGWPMRLHLRFVFVHSIVLAVLVELLVALQAYVYPLRKLVVK